MQMGLEMALGQADPVRFGRRLRGLCSRSSVTVAHVLFLFGRSRTIGIETWSDAVCCPYSLHILLQDRLLGHAAFDKENSEHLRWVYDRARERAKLFGIEGESAASASACGSFSRH